jgi:hypothetical protein
MPNFVVCSREAAAIAAAMAMLLCLTGCFPDQERQLAACKASVTPETIARTGPKAAIATLETCMRGHGYARHQGEECDAALDAAESPYCYAPRGWISYLGFRWEMRSRLTE